MRKKVVWEKAEDIDSEIKILVSALNLDWIDTSNLHTFRSYNASTRAYARIWGLSRIFQLALGIKPAYVIEVISEKFDKLPKHEQDKILIHELTHIPRSFSGSLAPHRRRRRGRKGFEDRVSELVNEYMNNKK